MNQKYVPILVWLFAALVSGQNVNETQLENICRDRNGYDFGTLISASLDQICQVKCLFSKSTKYPTTNSNNDPDFETVVERIVYRKMNNLEPCGDEMVCVKGKCEMTEPKYHKECSANFLPESIAVKSNNSCIMICIRPDVSYDRYVEEVMTIHLPDRTGCEDTGMCNKGYCLPNRFFK